MKAQRALQDIANPDIITLQTIHAEMPVNDTLIATVDATNGIYDRGGQHARHERPVHDYHE